MSEVHNATAGHDDHHDEHHEQGFVSKYIFSTDHKTIAKQFLITGIAWAVIGVALSVIFRLQLGFPNMDMEWLRPILGKWITPAGKLDSEFYLALVTMHGTIMVFFVLTAGLSGTFSNFLIPLSPGKGHGLWVHEHVVVLVLLLIQCGDVHFFVH